MLCLFASLLILFSVRGSFADRECYHRERNECFKLDIIPDPSSIETPEDLLKLCRIVEASGSCVADAKERCDVDEEDVISIRYEISYLRTTCQEDNPIFQAIYNNFKCLTNVIKSSERSCYWAVSNKTRWIIKEHIDPLFDENRYDLVNCLYDVLEMSCQAINFEHHCGSEVREPIEDIFENMAVQMSSCTPELLDETKPFSEIFETLLVEDLELRNAVKEEDNE